METAAFFILGMLCGIVGAGLVLYFIFKSRLEIAIREEQARKDKEAEDFKIAFASQLRDVEANAERAKALLEESRSQCEALRADVGALRDELESERSKEIEASTRLQETEKRLEESFRNLQAQKELIETMKTELTNTFNALSAAALRNSNEEFIRLASESIGRMLAETGGKFSQHKEAIDGTVKPLQDLLKTYEQRLKEVEESRNQSFGALVNQLRSLSQDQERLRSETANLVNALRKPKVSGRWGEIGLRNVLTLSGMTRYIDFIEQESVDSERGKLQPDMIIKLPNGRVIVIDAKAPVDSYLNAISAVDERDKKSAIEQYISQIKNHIKNLSSKAYWDQFQQSPEMVVMYMPGESFFSAALEQDISLIEESTKNRVILATPTTLIALLRAIAYGWQQEQAARSALELIKIGKDIYDRLITVLEHFEKLGKSINASVRSYNDGVSSMQSRLIPSLRKMKDLGISSAKETTSLNEIEIQCKCDGPLFTEINSIKEANPDD